MKDPKSYVNKIFAKLGKKNEYELKNGWVEPIHEDFPFAKNGICAYIAAVGSGKTYNYLKFMAEQQYYFDEPVFETIVLCSTSGEFDETVLTYKDAITKSKLIAIKDNDLLKWLDEYITKSKTHKALMKFVRSDFKNVNEEMKRIIKENRLDKDPNRLLRYIKQKLTEIGWKSYPHRLCLIFDDFASHPLIKHKEHPLPRMLKKLRHFNINIILCVQGVKDLPKHLRREFDDLILFPGMSEEDFKTLIRETRASCFDYNELWQRYKKISNDRVMIRLHIRARRILFTYPD
jgi:hypothetical protein